MSKTLILFGAGGSTGSDNNGTPPLGYHLYDSLAIYNPNGWGALSEELKTLLRQDFEQGVIRISNEIPHSLPILQRAMAGFFFTFQPKSTNLYYRLALDLKRDNKIISLSSLNYERLLEISFHSANTNLCIGIPTASDIELNLPHGCCNLFCEGARGLAGGVSFAGMNVQINGQIITISDPLQFQQRVSNDAFPPVMSYFEPQKRTTSGDAFLVGQRDRFKQLTQEVNNIIVIGVKIREHDIHIWDTLKNAPGKFIYCSGSGEKSTYTNWVANNRTGKDNIFIDGYWSDKYSEIYNYII